MLSIKSVGCVCVCVCTGSVCVCVQGPCPFIQARPKDIHSCFTCIAILTLVSLLCFDTDGSMTGRSVKNLATTVPKGSSLCNLLGTQPNLGDLWNNRPVERKQKVEYSCT